MKKISFKLLWLNNIIFFIPFLFNIVYSETATDSLKWIRTGGPPGGLGYDIRYNFDNPDIWYVTDNFAGVHMSTDNGSTWQPANTGIPPQAGPTGDAIPIFSLTVDPHNPQIIWAGTNPTGRIYRSTDAGLTWERRDNGVTIDYGGGLTFRGFTIDPHSSDIVYAMGETSDPIIGFAVWGLGTGGIVFKTTNSGANWEKIWDGGIPSSLARYMWIDPRDSDLLYVSTGIFDRGAVGETGDPETDIDPLGGLGILKSTNGGDSWTFQNKANGLNMLYIGSLYMHPENPDILLAGAGHVLPGQVVENFLQNEYSPAGVYRTTNGGEIWTQVLIPAQNNMGECFTAVEFHPVYPNIAYAGSAENIHRSTDAGQTWTKVSEGNNHWGPPGIMAGWPIDLQCDPRDTNRIFANNYNGGNFLSEDGGVTWQNASNGYTGSQTRGIGVDPFNPAHVYVAGRSGIWRTDDGGANWIGIFYPPEYDPPILGIEWMTIGIDPHLADHVLSASHLIMESFNKGTSWTVNWSYDQIKNDLPKNTTGQVISTIAFAPSDKKIIYASLCADGCVMGHERGDPICGYTGGGVILSTDGGTTWERAVDNNLGDIGVLDLTVDPSDANTAYAAAGNGLFKTTNKGTDWTILSGFPANLPIRTTAVDPKDSQYLLTGLEGIGIYMSSNGGQTWNTGYAGLEPNGSLHDIVFDPVNSNIVYTSDFYSGVYRSTDRGLTWTQINNGLRTRAAMKLSISSDGQHLYVITDGEGVFRLDINGPPTGIELTETSPGKFYLKQNYPNPFNPVTFIEYELPKNSSVQLRIFNVTGRLIRTLCNTDQLAGRHIIRWNGKNEQGISVSSGLYFYKLETEGNSEIRKMIFMK
jgi:photosystem II stability/assembly factor-like uncharacterized protein